jgi:Trk-type K+ transport system membrane component
MFLGRVGIFTFFLFLLGRDRRSKLIYPEERMIMN